MRCSRHYGYTCHSGPARPDCDDSCCAVYDLLGKTACLCAAHSGVCASHDDRIHESSGHRFVRTLHAGNRCGPRDHTITSKNRFARSEAKFCPYVAGIQAAEHEDRDHAVAGSGEYISEARWHCYFRRGGRGVGTGLLSSLRRNTQCGCAKEGSRDGYPCRRGAGFRQRTNR